MLIDNGSKREIKRNEYGGIKDKRGKEERGNLKIKCSATEGNCAEAFSKYSCFRDWDVTDRMATKKV